MYKLSTVTIFFFFNFSQLCAMNHAMNSALKSRLNLIALIKVFPTLQALDLYNVSAWIPPVMSYQAPRLAVLVLLFFPLVGRRVAHLRQHVELPPRGVRKKKTWLHTEQIFGSNAFVFVFCFTCLM